MEIFARITATTAAAGRSINEDDEYEGRGEGGVEGRGHTSVYGWLD